jgi:RNA polymerase sigma-70 factor, ECF subfamily
LVVFSPFCPGRPESVTRQRTGDRAAESTRSFCDEQGISSNAARADVTRCALRFATVETDADLLGRLQGGDEQAFVMLVQRYQPPMLRLARSMVSNDAVAEEAVQDTWMGVVRGIDRFEGRSSLKTWLFRILVNRVRSARDRERAGGLSRGPSVDPHRFDASGQWVEPVPSWDAEIDARVDASAVVPVLRDALDALPPRQRAVVLLRDVEGLSSDEACAVLGIRAGNQRILLHRGRASLREVLASEMREV